MRGTRRKGRKERKGSPPPLTSKAGVTAEVCLLLLLFQPGGYLNPGQPSSLHPYLHRTPFPPKLLLHLQSFDSIKSIYIIRTDSLITFPLGYNLLVNLSSSPGGDKKARGNDGGKEGGKKAVVDRWMRSCRRVASDKQPKRAQLTVIAALPALKIF